MAIIRADIDTETLEKLVGEAGAERRNVHAQAAVILRRHFGLPFPYGNPNVEHSQETNPKDVGLPQVREASNAR